MPFAQLVKTPPGKEMSELPPSAHQGEQPPTAHQPERHWPACTSEPEKISLTSTSRMNLSYPPKIISLMDGP